jgi:hypothetical protein
MAILIRAASPIWKLIIVSAAVLSGILILGGILLAIIGGTAQTTIKLFGNEFSSTSIGVALTFIGAVLAVVTLRRVLTSVDNITTGGGSDDESRGEKAA